MVVGLNHQRRIYTVILRYSVWISISSFMSADKCQHTNFHNILISAQKCLTSVSPVYTVESPENHTAASVLNPAACFHPDAGVSDGKGWTSVLKSEKHS